MTTLLTERTIALLIVVSLILLSALGVVYSKHRSRLLFVSLQELQAQHDALNVEWGRLQLEQSTWATHGRIDKAARMRLNMQVPSTDSIEIVEQ
jgi:cell division protein FtsL